MTYSMSAHYMLKSILFGHLGYRVSALMNPYISMDGTNWITFGLVTRVPWPIVSTLNAEKYIIWTF